MINRFVTFFFASILIISIVISSVFLTGCSVDDESAYRETVNNNSASALRDLLGGLNNQHQARAETVDTNEALTIDTPIPLFELINYGVENPEAIANLIMYQMLQDFKLREGRIVSFQVVLTTDGDHTYAIAYPFTEGDSGQVHFSVFSISGTPDNPSVALIFKTYEPLSPGYSFVVYEVNGEYLVCGCVKSSHYDSVHDSRIDWSDKSYMTINSSTENVRLCLLSDENLCSYICILQSKPSDITIYDSNNAPLYKLSEEQIDEWLRTQNETWIIKD